MERIKAAQSKLVVIWWIIGNIWICTRIFRVECIRRSRIHSTRIWHSSVDAFGKKTLMECIRPGQTWNQLSVYGHNRVYAASYRVYTASCRVYTASYNVYTASNRVYTATNRVYTATECMRPKLIISMCFASVWCECIRPRCRKYGIPISFDEIVEKTRGLRVDENDLKSSGDPIRWKVTIFICFITVWCESIRPRRPKHKTTRYFYKIATKCEGYDSMETNSNLQGFLVRPVATDDHSEKTQGQMAEESKENPLSFW